MMTPGAICLRTRLSTLTVNEDKELEVHDFGAVTSGDVESTLLGMLLLNDTVFRSAEEIFITWRSVRQILVASEDGPRPKNLRLRGLAGIDFWIHCILLYLK